MTDEEMIRELTKLFLQYKKDSEIVTKKLSESVTKSKVEQVLFTFKTPAGWEKLRKYFNSSGYKETWDTFDTNENSLSFFVKVFVDYIYELLEAEFTDG